MNKNTTTDLTSSQADKDRLFIAKVIAKSGQHWKTTEGRRELVRLKAEYGIQKNKRLIP